MTTILELGCEAERRISELNHKLLWDKPIQLSEVEYLFDLVLNFEDRWYQVHSQLLDSQSELLDAQETIDNYRNYCTCDIEDNP